MLKGFTPLFQPQLWCQTCFDPSRVLSHLSDTLGTPRAGVDAQAADSPSVPHLRWLMQRKKKPPSAWVSEELMHSACLFPDRLRSCDCRPEAAGSKSRAGVRGWWCPLQGTFRCLGHPGGWCTHCTPIWSFSLFVWKNWHFLSDPVTLAWVTQTLRLPGICSVPKNWERKAFVSLRQDGPASFSYVGI